MKALERARRQGPASPLCLCDGHPPIVAAPGTDCDRIAIMGSMLRTTITALLFTLLAVACGGRDPVPALTGDATRRPCDTKQVATQCFDVTVTNRGAAEATGECWVAAIYNYRKELGRSDSVAFEQLPPGEVVEGTVTLSLARGQFAKSPTFPVHCDPGGSD